MVETVRSVENRVLERIHHVASLWQRSQEIRLRWIIRNARAAIIDDDLRTENAVIRRPANSWSYAIGDTDSDNVNRIGRIQISVIGENKYSGNRSLRIGRSRIIVGARWRIPDGQWIAGSIVARVRQIRRPGNASAFFDDNPLIR